MEAFVQHIIAWINANHAWASFTIFMLALAESLAVVGLFIPAAPVMLAIGGLVGTGALNVWHTLFWAIMGAIAGDGISYIIGIAFKERLYNIWPFTRYPLWLDKGKQFFQKHGGKSIVFGRFVGPVRPFVPVVAGMLAMPANHFILTNILSAVLWAPVYILPGLGLSHWFL
jgi:membrane protein DedA with SNARE-associated domain